MQNRHTLWIFPLLTQLIFSLIGGLMSEFSVYLLGTVFLIVSLPTFLVAIACVKFNYHRRQLLPIGFWCGVIGFFYALIAILASTMGVEPTQSLWEESLMAILYALSYAAPAILYGLLVLRPFLRKPVFS